MANNYPRLSFMIDDAKKLLTTGLETSDMSIVTVEDCVEIVASQCDGAIEKDWLGFNASHFHRGHNIAALFNARLGWSESQRIFAAEEIIPTYQEQIKDRLNAMGKNGSAIVNSLIQAPVFRYKEAFAVEEKYSPYVHFNPAKVSYVIHFPAARDGTKYDKSEIMSEMGRLFINGKIRPFDKKEDFLKWFDTMWKKGATLERRIGDNSQFMIDELKSLGMMVDSRIDAIFKSPHKCYLKVEIGKTEKEKKDYPNMKPYLRVAIKMLNFDQTRIDDLKQMLTDTGSHVYPQWVGARNSWVLPLGDKNLDAIESFCGFYNVGDSHVAREALLDEKKRSNQKKSLVDKIAHNNLLGVCSPANVNGM